jgi:predicted RNA binding protein YcfA (HicA-like mRNA interferase family)
MPKLPVVTGSEAIAAFARNGFALDRVSKSSHHVLKKPGHRFLLTVPVHGAANLKPGLLRALIKSSGMTVEQFLELLAQ